ncbi:BTAD domain-containing putative transcriptional regulator [Mycobacterium noviomagense]|uniref:ATPase n=3 Tax=Mycobacterium noviomagense TaxID=459858 RepID=A0ABX3SZL3_9MYCO|nr:hypothetical protein BST37_20515 [Mycobacterium noviomagense]
MELGVLGPLQVRQDGTPVMIPGAKPRAILTMLGLHSGSVVSADALVELLWGDDPPRTAAKALQTHISSLRRTLGDGVVVTEGAGWTLAGTEVDASRYKLAAKMGRDAAAAGDTGTAVARFDEALTLWRGTPELPDSRRGVSERTRWSEGHAALVEDRADALLATGRAAEIVGELEAAVTEAPLRERRWGQLMLALYRAGRQGEALGAYQRARSLLADELGVDPGPELRRLQAAIVAQDAKLDMPVAQQVSTVTRAVTFLLTDIEGSTAAWEAEADAMAAALARHDELVEQVVTSRGGRLIKTRGEGDATFSVFDRPSAAAAAAIELQDAITHEPWALRDPMRIRVALHTGEVELRDGDYFGRAVNRAARLRSLAAGGQILCSGATAELVIDSLPDDVVLADLGMRQLRNLARPEHVFELRLETEDAPKPQTSEAPVERPALPAVLVGAGPFVGRVRELERLLSAWQTALARGAQAVLIAGEPGVGKTRLAGEWSRHAYEQGAVVLYGRCDEDLGAPYQPFAEALRSLVPSLGANRLRGLRGVEALLPLVPGLTDVLPDLSAPPRADPDTERYALFDAVVALLEIASASAPVVLILDDLHWAAKPTLLLLRHLLRFGEHASVQIVGTYRSTDLDRSHPLAAMLADLHRDGTDNRISLGGLDEDDVTAYVAEAGYDDEELARALASVTGGNPFFLIEALRHVDESGGVWDPSTLPQGVREAVSRRLSRLPAETNKALAAAAVVGSRFAVDLVERVVGEDLVDAFDEACKAGIVIEEPGGRYRFNHAIVRQSLLAELASVRRMRLHQRIATTLENEPGADDELLAELAYHYFECAWAGNAAKAVEYCRRAADQAMARLAYEGAADLYDRAVHALEELDEELPDREDQQAELLVARCEALLAAGDVVSAAGAVSQLQSATVDSARLAAWATCFDGQLSMLVHPERLDEVEAALGVAANKLAELDDAAGEAKAHTVRAGCLARLGRIADCEIALDNALTAARRARDHRRVNAVLAGAPLAALWGPNPVPRAGGRCLDVVRLLRITTDSPAVEATSTRCQAVLEAFRGRATAARRMIDSARRTVTELGLRHALLEVEQFAGIVELVGDDPAAAERHLRQAYNGFRRMGLEADTAETAALLGRTCLALDRDTAADELCSESERLAGHALKAAIAWRTLRALLLSRRGEHGEARRVAEAAVALAERTDLLVDHGDACLALATVWEAAGDTAAARAAAERAADLYEQKGAAALAERARQVLDKHVPPTAPAPPEPLAVELETAAVRAGERVMAAIDREAWDEFEGLFAPDGSVESRRKIVGFGQGEFRSDEVMRQTRRDLETGAMRVDRVAIAARGERLALQRVVVSTPDVSAGAPRDEFLQLYGIDDEGRIAQQVWFDVEDIDAAMAELDAMHARFESQRPPAERVELDNACVRAGERLLAAVERRDFDQIEQMFSNQPVVESRRKIVGFTQSDLPSADWVRANRRNLEAGTMRLRQVVIAVRGERLALSRLRVDSSDASPGAPYDEFLSLYGIDEDGRFALQVWFDLEDIDAAIAELDARYLAGEAAPYAKTWSVIAGGYTALNRREIPVTTPDFASIDHRRGTAFAPGELIEYLRAGWDLGQDVKPYIEAVHRLSELGAVITHAAYWTSSEGFNGEWREVHFCTTDGEAFNRSELFDEADLDTAIAKFDQLSRLENACARVVREIDGAAHRENWEEIEQYLAPEIVLESRRRIVGFPRAVVTPSQWVRDVVRSAREMGGVRHRHIVVAVRGERLALTRLEIGTADAGAGAPEDKMLQLCGLDEEGRMALHVWFDVAHMEAAIAELDAVHGRSDEQQPKARRLENPASRLYERFKVSFAARNWPAITDMIAENLRKEDRRRVVNAGAWQGRDALIAELRAIADVGIEHLTSDVIAIRGAHLVLSRVRASTGDFQMEYLDILQVDADERLVAHLVFDVDDVDAAIAELDARYLAGEAAAHAQTWSLVAGAYSAINRHELASTTPDFVNVDHRRAAAYAPGDLIAYVRAGWDLGQDINTYIEAVHRLDNLGAVVTHAAHGSSSDGFNAEWRGVQILTVQAGAISRSELFDEANIDAALARFEELGPQAHRLENAAIRVLERYFARFAARDWDVMAKTLTDDFVTDDRRRVVNAGVRRGRDAEITNMRSFAEIGILNIAPTAIATRAERLVLCRHCVSFGDWAEPSSDVTGVVQVNADNQISAHVMFDADDLEAAVAELDSRYLAGEAAAHAHAWSVIAEAYAAFNRREHPTTTPDWVNIDHRRAAAFAPGDMIAYIRAAWDDSPDTKIYIEAVHRLSNVGAVVTHVANGISQVGFDAEWRDVLLLTVQDDAINRCELFDEADLDAALATFDQLSRSTPRLENAASRVAARFTAYYTAGDWQAMADVLAENYSSDDRRRVVGSGVRHGRDAHLADMRARAEIWPDRMSTVVATRGERLALIRIGLSSRDQGHEAFFTEVLIIDEINADERLVAGVAFDHDDFDSAIAELDARYLAGDAAPYARTWSVIMHAIAAGNRNELPPATPDWVTIDHRRGRAFDPGELSVYIRATWDIVPNTNVYAESVHRLSNLGAVVTTAVHGTSRDGFDADWREVSVVMVDGNHYSRCEMFDEADLDAAIAQFDELSQPARRLENAASQADQRS